MFFILEMIILLPQRCQNLSVDLELLRCSRATEEAAFPGCHFPGAASLELLQLPSIKGMAPVPR